MGSLNFPVYFAYFYGKNFPIGEKRVHVASYPTSVSICLGHRGPFYMRPGVSGEVCNCRFLHLKIKVALEANHGGRDQNPQE